MKTYCHAPWVPQELEPLLDLAYNFWWTTDRRARDLFERLSPGLWRVVNHNPVRLLRLLTRGELENLARDAAVVAAATETRDRMKRELEAGGRFRLAPTRHGDSDLALDSEPTAAYFSAEFGLHESLPIYSGGLGILAGDHLRSTSDLGVPFCGIGLLYRRGYFHQRLSLDDWQVEVFEPNGSHDLPIKLIEHDDGSPFTITLHLPERDLRAQVWVAQVGRTSLLLLDSYLHDNWYEDREVTARLYDSNREVRLKQEILLGVGGVLALEGLGMKPRRFHMNEGHSAFMVLERAAGVIRDHDVSFEEARQILRPTNVFTTHTPVPAGHESFPRELMDPFLLPRLDRLRLSPDEFYALGTRPGRESSDFEMTSLAIRFSEHINGVSKLHGEVSRRMWNVMWPEKAENDVPIGHVTNGVHLTSWVGDDMGELYGTAFGDDWRERQADVSMWAKIDEVTDEVLWEARSQQRARLVKTVLRHAQNQLIRRNVDRRTLIRKITGLRDDALTIGFARRFATYKRATLLLAHRERLGALMSNADRPVQIILAGKAHPADDGGKRLIQEMQEASRDDDLFGRLIVLEDYDAALARQMVQGCDVWLNTPRPPQEASGTSGMKACANGALTVSTHDGWWVEGRTALNGWTIGRFDDERPHDEMDADHADQLFAILEDEVVPAFYDRDDRGLPSGWLQRVRETIRTVPPYFNTSRMVREYVDRYYVS